MISATEYDLGGGWGWGWGGGGSMQNKGSRGLTF